MEKPLKGYNIVEFAGIGPGPHAGMFLADLGAQVIEINRIIPTDNGIPLDYKFDLLRRGKKSICLDIKSQIGQEIAKKIINTSDVLIDPFRPGVMEKLNLGPKDCFETNEKLIYGRMTGFGQDGPMAKEAGHDLNYISLSGVLSGIGEKNSNPIPPLNLIGDFGGGGNYLVIGIISALLSREKTKKGIVIDASMVDGSAHLMTLFYGLNAAGILDKKRGYNILDGGAPYYKTYKTADDKWIAVAAIEEKFYFNFLKLLNLDLNEIPDRSDKNNWEELNKLFSKRISKYSLNQIMKESKGIDACLSPVLELEETIKNNHNAKRNTFINIDGINQPAPAPRFNNKQLPKPTPPVKPGNDTKEILISLGYTGNDIINFKNQGFINN
ncbi:MAG: Acetyl-CoA:oxalate CoA-transferase [Alphaproteobacteria bacterium MarineAlpha2_Bin1]|nr:MAG: Acetyl-CoA:oxalate CoA-transferase [Alphaproteobacteria bacterium MarineAlpha2_Bin1]|tara:strand:+ start:1191 stop:2339 length:1149 start_codon:yes stop_codon:yes gene_type:complete